MRKLSGSIAEQQHDMTSFLTAKSSRALRTFSAFGAASVLLLGGPARAQQFPITAEQRATAKQVASAGVPLADLVATAPDRYTVKSGDTLWDISRMYLKTPWRWPALWGMNLNEIHNPHRIFPGQILALERGPGGATLRIAGGVGALSGDTDNNGTVRISPKNRIAPIDAAALPLINPSVIAPFLSEPMIVDGAVYDKAPVIVAGQDGRLMLSPGDRIYAQGPQEAPLADDEPAAKKFRVFGKATALKDPDTQQILGYEVAYAGTATLVKPEERLYHNGADGKVIETVVAAGLDITSIRQEVRIGYRLLPNQPLQIMSYAPHAPAPNTSARIVSVYGDAVTNAGQNQVVVISKGASEGVDVGTVMAILNKGGMVPATDPRAPRVQLPNERVGLLMVFRTFEHLSYALVLEITGPVRVGDHLVTP